MHKIQPPWNIMRIIIIHRVANIVMERKERGDVTIQSNAERHKAYACRSLLGGLYQCGFGIS